MLDFSVGSEVGIDCQSTVLPLSEMRDPTRYLYNIITLSLQDVSIWQGVCISVLACFGCEQCRMT